jgi:hypothetical protein
VILGSDSHPRYVPDLLTLPIPPIPLPISDRAQAQAQINSSKSRCCVLPYVPSHCPSHPRLVCATIQGQVNVARSPRDPERGHDPSLGAPMPGHHRAWLYCWSKPSALRAPVTRSQTPNCFLPSLSPHAVQALPASALCCKHCLCLQAGPEPPVELCTVLRQQRVATMTCRAHRFPPTPQVTEHLISCQRISNSIATCDLNCNDTC